MASPNAAPAAPNADSSSAGSGPDSEDLFPYSRDDYVAAITDFYTLMTRLHVPESALRRPPPGGWPNITPKNYAGFGKSEFVVDLLKHLPYISDGDPRSLATQVHYKCNVLDYSVASPAGFGCRFLKFGELVAHCGDDPVSADEVVLFVGYESGGRYVLLNTATGQVIEEMVRCCRTYEDDAMGYFEGLVEDYRQLRLVPVPGYNTIDMMGSVTDVPSNELPDPRAISSENQAGSEADVRWLRYIYRNHGWPGADYRKEEALKMIKEYMEITPYQWTA